MKVGLANAGSLVVIADDLDVSHTLVDVNSLDIPHTFSNSRSNWDGVATPTVTVTITPTASPSPTVEPCGTDSQSAYDCNDLAHPIEVRVGDIFSVNIDCGCSSGNPCGCGSLGFHEDWDSELIEPVVGNHRYRALRPGTGWVSLQSCFVYCGHPGVADVIIREAATPTPKPEDIPVLSALTGLTEGSAELDRNGDGVLDAADLY